MKKFLRISVLGAAIVSAAGVAHAQATIFNTGDPATATVALGVNPLGNLSTAVGAVSVQKPDANLPAPTTGLAFRFPDGQFYDTVAYQCLCEGWGVSGVFGGGTARTGYASADLVHPDGAGTLGPGTQNLTLDRFESTPSSILSIAHLTDQPDLTITHSFAPAAAAPGALFEGVVTITNNSGQRISDVKYARAVDFDVPPVEQFEYLTIQGVAASKPILERSHNYGFVSPDPLTDTSGPHISTVDRDFVDFPPQSVSDFGTDQGAYFRFNLGALAAGESRSFSLFYGAAGSEADALAALASVKAELYALAQSGPPLGDPLLGTPATFILAFTGLRQPSVPEPATFALLAVALFGLLSTRHRRR